AVCNSYDLNTMSVPQKYREIGDFHEYYSGARKAPYLTLFVGENHEASSHLQELHYESWVVPNIFYLGAANVVRIGDLRIAGLSGIWKGYNYNKAHFERLPYDENEIKSLYHVDIGISHDWPRGIEWQDDHRTLFKQKDRSEAEAKAGRLGSAAASYVMDRLRPAHWFSAHLHCKFAATVDYGQKIEPGHRHVPVTNGKANQNNGTTNAGEIEIDLEDDEEAADQVTDPKPP
ncbi:MAG: hypothetical protein Q9191_008527, partial [Dirinaria sp. TL-2023a]